MLINSDSNHNMRHASCFIIHIRINHNILHYTHYKFKTYRRRQIEDVAVVDRAPDVDV